MNEIIMKEDIKIENMIYVINGIYVMFDSDLGKLYNVETKRINEAVKNNPRKFPKRYAFRVSESEFNFLKSKKSTSKGGSRKGHTAFTEQGVAMLATILKSDVAIDVNIKIMDTFVLMRHYLNDNKDVYKTLNAINTRLTNQKTKLLEHDDKFNYIFSKFDKKEKIFLAGERYDAYSNFISIFKEAKEELIIIDSYADITLLDLIRNINCNIILITKDSPRLSDIEITKYNSQYNNLKVIRNNSFHDRYFILDRKIIYHSGASLNSAGNKTFMINKLEDKFVINIILDNVIKII